MTILVEYSTENSTVLVHTDFTISPNHLAAIDGVSEIVRDNRYLVHLACGKLFQPSIVAENVRKALQHKFKESKIEVGEEPRIPTKRKAAK